MLTLYQFPRAWNLPNPSHFCTKVETYLRLINFDYEIIETLPLKAPKGKLPYITDDGVTVADSRLIVEYLAQKTENKLDRHLTTDQIAVMTAFQRLLEEHFFWLTMFTRWHYTDNNWQINKQAIFGALPRPIRFVIAPVYRRLIQKQIHGHGTGRLDDQEIFSLAKTDLDALARFLGDKTYVMGDQPSSLDASAYGFLANALDCPIESPIKDYALTKTNLRAYCQRIKREYFPELTV